MDLFVWNALVLQMPLLVLLLLVLGGEVEKAIGSFGRKFFDHLPLYKRFGSLLW